MYLMAYFLIRRLYMLSANNLIVGKPPALLGDSQCLTFAAVLTFSIATRNDVGSGLRMFFKAFNQLERNVHCRCEVNLTRLRVGPFEGPENDKPPALPEVHDWSSVAGSDWPKDSSCVQKIGFTSPLQKITTARVDLISANLCATKI